MDALTRRMRAPRTLRHQVLRVLVPRVAGFAAVVFVLLLGKVMAVSPTSAPFEALPTAVPTWSSADRAAEPDCVAAADWPEGTLADEVVVHRFADDSTVRMAFTDAWAANHDVTEVDDLWVLAVCP
ncbi:MAG: hypothetical protein JWQ74_615 [Marmoricola sp.]|nr:hypothetical protein [Marmoricola sp.]